MLENMSIEESCEIIEDFCTANRVDALTGMELMVKHWIKLNRWERTAVTVFMSHTKKIDNKKKL